MLMSQIWPHEKDYRKIMACGPGQDKCVPNHVVIAQIRPEIKTYAGTIKKTADAKQREGRPMQVGNQWLDRRKAGPTDAQIEID